MLASEIITRARETLFDTTTPYRWSDAELLRWLSDGLTELWIRRPDALYVSAVVTTSPAAVSAVGSNIVVLDQFRAALMDYICFKAFLRDSDDQANAARSTAHFKLFMAEIS